MSAAPRLNPNNIERLRKIWALTNSPNAGEAAAARERTAVYLAKYGKTIADVPDLLASTKTSGAGPKEAAGFTFYDNNNPNHMAEYERRDQRRRSERARREKPQRDAVIELYGSVEAALAPCDREVMLKAAVSRWAVPCDPPHGRWTHHIGEWSDRISDMPVVVREALSGAYALPRTITEAADEFDYWERRDREIGLVLEDTSDTQLDLAAYGRQEIVRSLLETGLRAQTIGDVLARQRYLVALEYSMLEVDRAVLADLEHLASMAAERPVHFGRHKSASDRRAEVMRLLSNVDTVRLPDREIARMVGVSPQTVGNIRRSRG